MKDFKDKKILVLGLGLNQGGLGAAKFFSKQGSIVRVTDLKDETILNDSINELKEFKNIEFILGKHRHEDFDWADIIIRNPAIKDNNEFLIFARNLGKQIETDFSIFLDFINRKNLIAITGTKGKSTTAALINVILTLSLSKGKNLTKKEVLLAGNIGKSVLDTIPFLTKQSFVIVEISSFQLHALPDKKLKPHIAVITNIFPDHLNWHSSMKEYIAAKRKIAQNQGEDDLLFIRKNDPVVDKQKFLKGLKSKIIYFSKQSLSHLGGVIKNPALQGSHNQLNIASAFAVAKQLGISEDNAIKVLKNFKGAQFRLQLIKKVKGIKIYNDSASTNPQSTIQALKTFPDSILITGGMNKGLDYQELAEEIGKNAKAVYFLDGDATEELIKYIKDTSIIKGKYSDLEKLLEDIKKQAKPGDTILFSPGATSFNLFQNEFDRGRKFNQAVKNVFSK